LRILRKKTVAIADGHSGHRVGLAPPRYQNRYSDDRFNAIQREMWKIYTKAIDRQKPIHTLFYNGDLIDGKGERSGGTELITTDRLVQVEMAVEAMLYTEAEHIFITFGTGYHTGSEEDFEQIIADKVKAELIDDQIWVDVNGVVFDLKHKISNSSVPYSKAMPVSKERLQNLLWNEHQEQPKADIILRAHVHEFVYTGNNSYLGIVLPALQGQGSKFGGRQCSSRVDFGIVWFDIEDRDDWSWGWDIKVLDSQKREAIKV